MKKLLLSFFLISLGIISFSQENDSIVAVKFVDNDTIFIRFGFTKPETFKKFLKYGFKIERFEDSPNNVASKKTFFSKPSLEIIKENKYSSDEDLIEVKALIEQYVSVSSTAESNQFLYAILMLSSTTDKSYLQALGLVFYDTDFDSNKTYYYRISLNTTDQNFKQVYTTLKVSSKNLDKNPDFNSLTYITKNKRNEVYLKWNASEIGSDYSSFWVEKSIDSINFKPINEAPVFLINTQYEKNKTYSEFVDTVVVEGETYFYRIAGINHFAENGGHSNIVKVRLNKSLKGFVKIDTVFANDNKRIISGDYSSPVHKDLDHLSHFILYRSDSLNSGYEVIDNHYLASNEKFRFETNSKLKTGDRNYYKVAAISVDGDTTLSFHYYFYTLDQNPPDVPTGLDGFIDEKGIVQLTWSKNKENDIKAYRIFWANDLNEEFVEASSNFVYDTVFFDTISLKSLTSEIYYQVSAVDNNFNNSKPSVAIKLNKPDTIPPVPCVFKSFKIDKGGVKLFWYNSSSIDVHKNYLIRETFGNRIIDTVLIWSDTTTYCIDQDVLVGKQYSYRILTEDKAPNVSVSKIINVNYETGIRPPVSNLNYTINREDKNIKLKWEQDNSKVYSYKIYRSKNEGHFILYKTIKPGEENIYVDNDLNINNTYRYKIKVVYKNGINSSFSNVIVVTY